jgi:hypothetical protein
MYRRIVLSAILLTTTILVTADHLTTQDIHEENFTLYTKAIIVDDEPDGIRTLKKLLELNCPEVEVLPPVQMPLLPGINLKNCIRM